MSKKRVFANDNNNLNFNDYLKYKNGKEIIKNIRTKVNFNKNMNTFLNYERFILLTKAYFKYFIIDTQEVIGVPANIYNSNASFIVYKNLVSHIDDCDQCHFIKDTHILCDKAKGILYPYGKYIENKISNTIYLHNRINIDTICKPICFINTNNTQIEDDNIINAKPQNNNCNCNCQCSDNNLCKKVTPLFIN